MKGGMKGGTSKIPAKTYPPRQKFPTDIAPS